MTPASSEFGVGSSEHDVFNVERLSVYQKAVDLADDVFRLTRSWKTAELWTLGDQFRRASLSIALNIAEGSGRTKRDFKHFLRNSRSSCYECLPILELCRRQALVAEPRLGQFRRAVLELTRMISGLMSALTRQQAVQPDTGGRIQ